MFTTDPAFPSRARGSRHAALLLAALLLSLAGCRSAAPPSADAPAVAPTSPFAHAPAATRDALEVARPVTAEHAMVVSAQHLATRAGVAILQAGGNAIDAAVAVGYAEAVTHPCCGNIGGGGFMTIRLADGKSLFLNFREKAPAAATTTMFQDENGNAVPERSTETWLGAGIPGTVMGLNTALDAYGTLPLATVMAPAIKLARDGFILTQGDADITNRNLEALNKHPIAARIFGNAGKPWQAGDRLVQTDLANTLETIASGDTDAFYKGPIAAALVKASSAHGGIFSQQDFADYNVEWLEPIQCGHGAYTIISAPPPSSGGTTLCMILNILEPFPLDAWGYGSVNAIHTIAEAERRAFADRNTYLGDPDFVDNPLDMLLSPAHADKRRATINPDRATPSAAIESFLSGEKGTHTTHYSVYDTHGNAVAVTYTINYLFGIKQIAGNTGFFLNNEMDDFTAKPGAPNGADLVQGSINKVEPGKRPLSSMTPTIVLRDGKPFMLTGSPGSATIISTTLESIINVVDFGMNLQQAIDAPRMHQQWYPEVVSVEDGLMTPATKAQLEAMGHTFETRRAIGADEAILVNPATGLVEGANDPRRPAGLAAGY